MTSANLSGTSFRESVRSLLHERLLDAAQEITVAKGWSYVTMVRIADIVGVSRQTVYNEFGSKPELADELVMRELGRFLDVVRSRLMGDDDLVAGIESACEGALTMAGSSPLLRAVLSSIHQRENDLVPLLTTESQGVIDVAKSTVVGVIHERHPDLGLTDVELDHAADAVVRLVLSHIMRPSSSPDEAAKQIAWIAGKVIDSVER
ncbi:MAG: TetR/AcrR family transcriptional regulator [Kineosporiaceae bacterium]|nr:TetR/AcrR family transcriptional regulator [Aeromicrobium sp.]